MEQPARENTFFQHFYPELIEMLKETTIIMKEIHSATSDQ